MCLPYITPSVFVIERTKKSQVPYYHESQVFSIDFSRAGDIMVSDRRMLRSEQDSLSYLKNYTMSRKRDLLKPGYYTPADKMARYNYENSNTDMFRYR